MTYKTLDAILEPDGRLNLPADELPDHPVQVMVTFLDSGGETALAEVGDYLASLADYEERLARGEIQWQ